MSWRSDGGPIPLRLQRRLLRFPIIRQFLSALSFPSFRARSRCTPRLPSARRSQLNKETGNRIRYRKVDSETGDDVEQANIIKEPRHPSPDVMLPACACSSDALDNEQ
jgi:hypothetical protein